MAKPDKPLTAEELAAPISRENFWRRVSHFVHHQMGSPDELPVIRPGTEEWNAWQEYFERNLRWLPAIMRQVLAEQAEAMTVPTPRPEQFDLAFLAEPGYRLRHAWQTQVRREREARKLGRQAEQTFRANVVQEAFRKARAMLPKLNNVFVSPSNPAYQQIAERYDRGDGGEVGELEGATGLWVPLDWLPDRLRLTGFAQLARRTTRARHEVP